MKDSKHEKYAADEATIRGLVESGKICPSCYSPEIIKGHWEGNGYAPECDYDECAECGQQWNIG